MIKMTMILTMTEIIMRMVVRMTMTDIMTTMIMMVVMVVMVIRTATFLRNSSPHLGHSCRRSHTPKPGRNQSFQLSKSNIASFQK